MITSSNYALAASLERFKQNREAAKVPTPLATFLYIYTHASYECYIDHMAGAKALASYLSPIDITNAPVRLPDMLASYELTELARALVPHTTTPHTSNLTQIENAIYAYFTKLR